MPQANADKVEWDRSQSTPSPDEAGFALRLAPAPGLDSWGDSRRDAGPVLFRESGNTDARLAKLTEGLTPFPEVGQEFLGFRLVAELGRGAFGRVYLARQGDLADRPVALKVSTGCFAESQKLARLQHTHIVPVYSFHRAGSLQAVCHAIFRPDHAGRRAGRPRPSRHAARLRQGPRQHAAQPPHPQRRRRGRAAAVRARRAVGPHRGPDGAVGRRSGHPHHVANAGGSELRRGGPVDRGAAGRGAGPRPRARRAAPRPQAGQRAADRRGAADAPRLQPGRGRESARRGRPRRRHPAVHGPGASRRLPGPAGGRGRPK